MLHFLTLLFNLVVFWSCLWNLLYVTQSSGLLWDGLIISMYLCNSASCSAASSPPAGISKSIVFLSGFAIKNFHAKKICCNIFFFRIYIQEHFLEPESPICSDQERIETWIWKNPFPELQKSSKDCILCTICNSFFFPETIL